MKNILKRLSIVVLSFLIIFNTFSNFKQRENLTNLEYLTSDLADKQFFLTYKSAVVTVLNDNGLGTGFYVDPFHIITNNHVVKDFEYVVIADSNGVLNSGKVVYKSAVIDMAIVKVSIPSLSVLTFGDSDKIFVGEDIYTIGSPYGLDNSFSKGYISGMQRDSSLIGVDSLLQISSNVAPGNSGSAVLNKDGEIVALVFAAIRFDSNYGFAVPINTLKPIIKDVISK